MDGMNWRVSWLKTGHLEFDSIAVALQTRQIRGAKHCADVPFLSALSHSQIVINLVNREQTDAESTESSTTWCVFKEATNY